MTSADDLEVSHFSAPDGARLAWREMGAGRTVVLLHGLFSNAWTNWLRYGHAATIAAAGYRVVMPELRAHGDSARPYDAASYPPDILADDGLALVRHLDLDDYDLGGYSLGGRTVVRMLARGARPGRAIVAGMGLTGLLSTDMRADHFREILTGLGTHERGSPQWLAEAFLKTTGGDPQALLPLLDSFVGTPRETLARLKTPVLVLSGVDDQDNGSASDLAALLPAATFREIPGNHMSAVANPMLGHAIAGWLNET